MGLKTQAADAAGNHCKPQYSDLQHDKARFRPYKIFAESPLFITTAKKDSAAALS